MAEILRNRPLLILALTLILGLTLREYPVNFIFVPLFWFLLKSVSKIWPSMIGLAIGIWLAPDIPSSGVTSTTFLEAKAQIVSVPRLFPEQIYYEIQVGNYRLRAREPVNADRSYGDELLVRGLVKPLREGTDEYLLQRNVVGRFEPISVEVVQRGPGWMRRAADVRRTFVAYSRSVLPLKNAAILDALCFNVEGGLSDEFEDTLRRTGTIHIISASGLHVFVLALAVEWLLGLLPIPRSAKLLLVFLLLAAYCAAAGLQPAIIRSVVMYVVASTAYLWQREADLLSALALSAALYLAWEPHGVFNLGFQFSFLTVAAFAIFGQFDDSPARSVREVLIKAVKDAFKTSNIAYWATLPLLLYYFGSISFVAIPSNLLIIPAAMVLVIGGMASFVVAGWFPQFAGTVASLLLNPLISYLEQILSLFGNLRIATVSGGFFSAYWLVPLYVAILFMVRERVRPA